MLGPSVKASGSSGHCFWERMDADGGLRLRDALRQLKHLKQPGAKPSLGGIPDKAAAGGVVPHENHQDSGQLGQEGVAGHKGVIGRSQAHIGQNR